MRRGFLVALIAILVASTLLGQENSAPGLSEAPRVQPSRSVYHSVDPGVTPPQLLPSEPLPVFTGKCKKQDDSVEFVATVNERGEPRDIIYSRGLVTDADRLALQIVTADRFTPGTHAGEPAAVVISITVSLKGCIETITDESGHKSELFHLRFQPTQQLAAIMRPPGGADPTASLQSPTSDGAKVYRVGGGVTAPIPLNSVAARYTDAASRAKINGICWISFVVDTNGIPENVKVIRGLDPGLDKNAIDAVNRYRFKPAMKDGQPVPVMLTIQIAFKVY